MKQPNINIQLALTSNGFLGHILIDLSRLMYSTIQKDLWNYYGYTIVENCSENIFSENNNIKGPYVILKNGSEIKHSLAYKSSSNILAVFSSNLNLWASEDKQYNSLVIQTKVKKDLMPQGELRVNLWDIIVHKIKVNEIFWLGNEHYILSNLYMVVDSNKILHVSIFDEYLKDHINNLKVK